MQLARCIERMGAASAALEKKVSDENLRAMVDAAQDASKAHAELLLAALARAKAGRK
jgi:hypothetical protein